MRPCPFCKGRGRVFPSDLNTEVWPNGLGCDSCNQTGDYDTMTLVRAYRLGRAHERSVMAGRLTGSEVSPELGFKTIKAAVVDDVRRQRFEDALQPNSIERQKLERRIADLLREREPLLNSLGRLRQEFVDDMEAQCAPR